MIFLSSQSIRTRSVGICTNNRVDQLRLRFAERERLGAAFDDSDCEEFGAYGATGKIII